MHCIFSATFGSVQPTCGCGWGISPEEVEEIVLPYVRKPCAEAQRPFKDSVGSKQEKVRAQSEFASQHGVLDSSTQEQHAQEKTHLVEAAKVRLSNLKETEDIRLASLTNVRQRLNAAAMADPSLKKVENIFMDDSLLLGVLRNSDYDDKCVCDKLLLVAQFFRDYPVPTDVQQKAEILEAMDRMFTKQKFRGTDGSAVIYIKDLSTMMDLMEKFPGPEVSSVMLERFLVELPRDENTQLCGVTFVEDLSKFSLLHMMQLKKDKDYLAVQKRQTELWNQHAFSFPFARCYILDAPWYFKGLWFIFKAFMSEEMKNKIIFTARDDFHKMLTNANPFDTSLEVVCEAFA
jgi:hypothetical protein